MTTNLYSSRDSAARRRVAFYLSIMIFRITYLKKNSLDCVTVTVEADSSVEAEIKVKKEYADCFGVVAIVKK